MSLEDKILLNMFSEAKQVGILYHYTTEEGAIKILKSNMIYSTYRDHEEELLNKKYNIGDYTSLTRGINNAYANPIIFVLDGNKLSNNYKIIPYAYNYNLKNWKFRSINSEFEERVVGAIKNLDKYLIKIVVNWDSRNVYTSDMMEFIKYITYNNIKIEHKAKTTLGKENKNDVELEMEH